METCFSKVTKRPGSIYQADLTPEPACRLTHSPSPFISGCSSISRVDWGELFCDFPTPPPPPRPNFEKLGKLWPVPQCFPPPKALGRRLPQIRTCFEGERGLFHFFLSSPLLLFPLPPPSFTFLR